MFFVSCLGILSLGSMVGFVPSSSCWLVVSASSLLFMLLVVMMISLGTFSGTFGERFEVLLLICIVLFFVL